MAGILDKLAAAGLDPAQLQQQSVSLIPLPDGRVLNADTGEVFDPVSGQEAAATQGKQITIPQALFTPLGPLEAIAQTTQGFKDTRASVDTAMQAQLAEGGQSSQESLDLAGPEVMKNLGMTGLAALGLAPFGKAKKGLDEIVEGATKRLELPVEAAATRQMVKDLPPGVDDPASALVPKFGGDKSIVGDTINPNTGRTAADELDRTNIAAAEMNTRIDDVPVLGVGNDAGWKGAGRGNEKIFPQVQTQPGDINAKTRQMPVRVDPSDKKSAATKFAHDLDEESQRYVKFWVGPNRNKAVVHANGKTGLSLDFSTDCSKRACAKGACLYCYVEFGRTQGKLKELDPLMVAEKKLGAPQSPKGVVDNPYRRELMYMPAKLVTAANQDGGLRMFSFGDYRPEGLIDARTGGPLTSDKAQLGQLLEDAGSRGLYVKAITKEMRLIEDYGDHPNLRINISTDHLPREMSNAPTIEEALDIKAGRPNIKIRSVAMNREQAILDGQNPNLDVVTMYHGHGPEKMLEIVKFQNKQLIDDLGLPAIKRELATWESMDTNTKVFKSIAQDFAGKVCCQGSKCVRDPTKCGFPLGMLIPGVMIPAWMFSEGETDKDMLSGTFDGYKQGS